MDILGLLREWYEIKQAKKDHCKSCLILQEQLTGALARESKLLAMVTHKPEAVHEQTIIAPQAITPKTVPWHIKRQLLEAEDRAKAIAMREVVTAGGPTGSAGLTGTSNPNLTQVNTEVSINELEKELSIGEGA